jgi:hypothetical protein
MGCTKQVVQNQVRRRTAVQTDAPGLASGVHHPIRTLRLEECIHGALVAQVRFGSAAADAIPCPAAWNDPDNSRAKRFAASGDEYPARIHPRTAFTTPALMSSLPM